MNNDLISREALKEFINEVCFSKEWAKYRVDYGSRGQIKCILTYIDNAPAIKTYCYFCGQTEHGQIEKRPQGEYVDISKLRLMTVEECAGHTIEYAMGWKACIEWLKKGGAE